MKQHQSTGLLEALANQLDDLESYRECEERGEIWKLFLYYMARSRPMKKTLNQIIDELRGLFWTIDESEGEMTPELEADLDAVEGELSEKAGKIAWVCDDMVARAKTMRERAAALSKQANSLETRSKGLRFYLLKSFQALDIKKLPLEDFPQMGIRKTPPKVELFDEHKMRNKADVRFFVEQPSKVDKKAVLVALKDGEKVPGCNLVSGERLHW